MRTTKARTIILDIITTADTPIDAAAILDQVQQKDHTINRATIFRNLNTLVKAGEMTKVDFGDGKARYEKAGHHHHHLICNDCGSVDFIDVCAVDEVAEKYAQKKSFKITSHKLEYFGLCKTCQK